MIEKSLFAAAVRLVASASHNETGALSP